MIWKKSETFIWILVKLWLQVGICLTQASKICVQTFNNFFPQWIVSKTDIYCYVQFLSCRSKSVTNKTITTTKIIVKLCGFVAFQLMSKPFRYIGVWPLCYVIVFFMKYCCSNRSGWHWVAGCCWLLEIKQILATHV